MKQCLRKYFKRFQKCPSLKLFGGSGKLSFYIFRQRKRRLKHVCFVWPGENDDFIHSFSGGQGKRRLLFYIYFSGSQRKRRLKPACFAGEKDDVNHSFSCRQGNTTTLPLYFGRLRKTTTFSLPF
jgi:hypothetical protein